MKIIEREMLLIESNTQKDFLEHLASQASFNSDGNITLRNYDRCDKSKDEIIVLNDCETNAIIKLFKELYKNNLLPF